MTHRENVYCHYSSWLIRPSLIAHGFPVYHGNLGPGDPGVGSVDSVTNQKMTKTPMTKVKVPDKNMLENVFKVKRETRRTHK